MTKKKPERVTFKISAEDLNDLKILALAKGSLTTSAMIRIAIKYQLNKNSDLINEQKKKIKRWEIIM